MVGGRTVSPSILPELLEALAEARAPDGVLKEALTVVACKAAVKAGESLSMNEMSALVEALESTPNPRTCPHGRPTTIYPKYGAVRAGVWEALGAASSTQQGPVLH